MPRTRDLRPGFFSNEVLAECEPLARLLFAGLWTIADRDGRLEDRPARIKAMVLPYDACDCHKLLGQLADRGFITRYAAAGRRCIQVNNFRRHQHPHPHEPRADIPMFVPAIETVVSISQSNQHDPQGLTESRDMQGQGRGFDADDRHDPQGLRKSRDKRRDCPTNLSPSSLLEEVGEVSPTPPLVEFETFWGLYPRKQAKKAARAAWQKLGPDAALWAAMRAALVRQQQSRQWREGVIPHPATWLNGRRWEDEVADGARPAETLAEKISRIRKEDECRRKNGTAGPPGTAASSG